VRPPFQSGVHYQRRAAVRILTVRLDDPWMHAAVESVGAEVLRVRHPLPACERIRVNEPAVVVVGPTVQWRDYLLLVAAAASVGAAIIEARLATEHSLVSDLRMAVDGVLARSRVAPEAAVA
jgi:hypothetical protein